MPVLDTDVCVDVHRGHASTIRALSALESREPLAITAITVQELVQGAYGSASPQKQVESLRTLLSAFEILEYDAAAGWIAGRLTAELAKAGTPIGVLDTMIGACAIAHGAKLATRNPKLFERLPGLEIETLSWPSQEVALDPVPTTP